MTPKPSKCIWQSSLVNFQLALRTNNYSEFQQHKKRCPTGNSEMKYSWANLFMGALGYTLKVRKLIWVYVELSFGRLKSTLRKVVSSVGFRILEPNTQKPNLLFFRPKNLIYFFKPNFF